MTTLKSVNSYTIHCDEFGGDMRLQRSWRKLLTRILFLRLEIIDDNRLIFIFNIISKDIVVCVAFLVGAFSLKEKSPTITVGSFFSADNLTLNGPLFLQFLQSYNFSISQFLTILGLRSSIFISFKKLNGAKGYFRLCETFFWKICFSAKGPAFKFLIFLGRMDFEKSQMVPPFSFFRHCETFFRKKISIKGSPIHQYFDILKSFWYFWALDMAPTWADPGLLNFSSLPCDVQ